MADGRVDIDVRANTGRLPGDLTKAQKELDRLTGTFNKQIASIEKQEVALLDLRRQLQAIAGSEIAPKDLTKMETNLRRINKELETQQKEYDAVIAKIQEVNTQLEYARISGRPEDIAKQEASLKILEDESLKIADAMEATRDKSEALSAAITKIRLDPASAAEAQKLADKITLAETALEKTKSEARATDEKMARLASGSKSAISAMQSFGEKSMSALGRVGSLISVIGSGFARLGSKILSGIGSIKLFGKGLSGVRGHATHASNGFQKLTRRITAMLGTVFVFNVINKAMREMRNLMSSLMQSNTEFASSFNAIKVNLLTAFAPIWEAIQPALLNFMKILERVTATLAAFISMLFGKTYAQSKASAAAIYNQSKAMDKSGKSAKNASKQLAAFDEINQQIEDSAGGAGDAAGGLEGLDFGAVEEPDVTWAENLKTIFDGLVEALQPTIEALKELWETLKGIGEAFLIPAAKDFYDKILEPIGNWILGTGLPSLINALNDILKSVDWEKLKSQLSSLWDAMQPFGKFVADSLLSFLHDFLVPVGSWVLGSGLLRFLEITTALFNEIDWGRLTESLQNFFKALAPFAIQIGEGLLDFYEHVLKPLAVWTVSEALPTFLDGLTRILTEVDWENIRMKLIDVYDAIAQFAGTIGEGLLWFYENVLVPVGIWALDTLFPTVLETVSAAFVALNDILIALQPIGLWLWEEFLQPLGQWAGDVIISALEAIVGWLQSFSDWISENEGLIQGIIVTIGVFAAAWVAANAILTLIPGIIAIVSGAISGMSGIVTLFASGTSLASAALGIFSSAIGFLASPITILTALIASFIYTIATIPEEMERAKESLSRIWNSIEEIFSQTIDLIQNIVSDFLDILKQSWDEKLEDVVTGVGKAVNDIFEWFSRLIDEFITPIISRGLEWLQRIWDESLSGVVASVLEFVGTVGENIVALWEEFIKPTFDYLMDYVVPVVKESFIMIVDIIGEAINTIMGVIDGLLQVLSGVIDFIVGVLTGDWEKAWNGIVKIFEGIFKGLESIVKGVVNVIINLINGMVRSIFAGINSVINAVNKLNIPGTDIGFNISSVTAHQIPRLKTGLDYVPYDDFPAYLHKGERVLTAAENAEYASVMSELNALPRSIIPTTVTNSIVDRGARQSGGDSTISRASLAEIGNIIGEQIAIAFSAIGTTGGNGGDLILELNGRELARASMDDFRGEAGRLGVDIRTVF